MHRYDFDVHLTPAARDMLRPGEAPIYAARTIFQHLSGREVVLDARRTLGVRRFTSTLPSDFGMRAVFGRLPEPDHHVGLNS